IWGGEFLVAGLADFERAAHLRTWMLPGGVASIRDVRRNAFALLSELGLLEHPGAARLLGGLDAQTRSVTATMIERDINSPRTSSMGRLFDAAAAILGICGQATYEGEPAIELEAAAWRALDGEIARSIDKRGIFRRQIDLSGL
ncbi:MAG: hydrogenase maturation protein HypF, partial [Collinsella sp.]